MVKKEAKKIKYIGGNKMNFMNLKDFAKYAEQQGWTEPKQTVTEKVVTTTTIKVVKPATKKVDVTSPYTKEELEQIALEEEAARIAAEEAEAIYDDLAEEYDDPSYVSFIKTTTKVKVVNEEKQLTKQQALEHKVNKSLKRGW